MSHGWFSLTHVLVFAGTLPIFTGGGAKTTIFGGKIFDKVLKWRLTIPQLGGIWEIKKMDSSLTI